MYLRKINKTKIEISVNSSYARRNSLDELCTLYLKGFVLNNEIIDEFLISKDYTLLSTLNGSFNLIVIDTTCEGSIELKCITDVVNSMKLFYKITETGVEISDDINQLINRYTEINVQGVACYIANGNMLNEITIAKNVYIMESASEYDFNSNYPTKKKYWNIDFNYNKDYEEGDLIKELDNIVVQAISARAKRNAEPILVSLSAGYDARSIFGILKKFNPDSKIDSFTYRTTSDLIKESDAELSEKISVSLGAEHYGVKSFDGDFISLLRRNVSSGKCIAHFCDELDAIEVMSKGQVYKSLFVGDEWFGRLDVPLGSTQEILDSVSISGTWGILWLKKYLKKTTFDLVFCELQSLTDEIVSDARRFENPHDQKDYLYLRQRVSHVNLTWREYFSSKIAEIQNPFLDRLILDFYLTVPPALRIEKRLFIKMITMKYRELFRIPIANDRRSLAGISYQKELLRNRDDLIKYIETNDSKLTDLISKQEIIDCIIATTNTSISGTIRLYTYFRKCVNALRRVSKFFDFVVSPFLGPRIVKIASSEKLVVRLLMLFMYLEYNNLENEENNHL